MIVYFANRRLEVLGMASTNLERSYIIKDDLQTEEVSSGISTLDLTVGWDMNDQKTLQEWMEVGNTVLMPQEEGSDEAKLYSIVQETIDTGSKSIEIYCEDAGLDFINEVAPAYSAGEAHEAQYYINKYLGDSGYEIGQNDMSTSASKKLSWDGESTVAERIQSIANSFGCEVSYTYQVHGMDVTHKYINLLSKRGDQETEPQIRLNIEADKITASKSIEDLATAFIVTGGIPKDSKDNKPITLIGYSYDDGNYYVDKTTGRVCSKQGMQAWTRLSSKYYNVPSGDATSGQIVKTYSYDTTDKATLVSHAVAELKKVDHPSATYEVEIPKLPEGVWIGDRVSIVDDAGELYVSARILGLEVSRTKQSVKITVGDYITRNAGISDQVEDLANQWSNSVAAMAEIAKQAAAAQSTADAANTAASKAQSTADSANTAAGNAQSTANGAATAAGKAQSTADSANTAASKAQSTADTASAKADNAAKVATNYVTDITGGGISVHQAGSTADAVKIDGESVDIVHGGKTVASYGETTVIGDTKKAHTTIGSDSVDISVGDRRAVGVSVGTEDGKIKTIIDIGYLMSDSDAVPLWARLHANPEDIGVIIRGNDLVADTDLSRLFYFPTRQYKGSFFGGGYLTGGKTSLHFTVPLNRPFFTTVSDVNLMSLELTVRQNGNYIVGSSSGGDGWKESVASSGSAIKAYDCTIRDVGGIHFYFEIAANSKAINNAPVGVACNFTMEV